MPLASLFRKTCKGENCVVFTAPPLTEIEKETYKYGNACFKYNTESELCSGSKKTVRFA